MVSESCVQYCVCLHVSQSCASRWGLTYVMSSGLIFRAAGAGGLQGSGTQLGPGLWSLPASPSGRTAALLYPISPWLPECIGLRVDLHLLVSWPVSSKRQNALTAACAAFWVTFSVSFDTFCSSKSVLYSQPLMKKLWSLGWLLLPTSLN